MKKLRILMPSSAVCLCCQDEDVTSTREDKRSKSNQMIRDAGNSSIGYTLNSTELE